MSVDVPPGLAVPFAVWCAVLGSVLGSFVNVVVARLPFGESVVHPRSRCPRCATPIRWYDNIPIVSWFVLRARCRACGERISARYPLVEAAGAGAALAAAARHGASLAAVAELAFTLSLLALALIDLDTWLLPGAITWPLLGVGLLLAPFGLTLADGLRPALYGAGLGFGAFAALAWIGEKALKKEALGFGDVWLLAGLGAWMGHASLIPIVLLASLQGSAVGLALIALGKGQPGPAAPSEQAAPDRSAAGDRAAQAGGGAAEEPWVPPRNAVPFGPFLVAGALEWLWLGEALARAVPVLRLFR